MSAPPQFGPAGIAENPKSKIPTWAWVLGIGCLGMCGFGTIILAAILFPVFSQARLAAREKAALLNGKMIALSMVMYTTDADDKMPPMRSAEQIEKLIEPNFPKDEQTKQILRKTASSYVWNRDLSGVSETDIPYQATTWMFHSTQNIGGTYVVGFVDGGARTVKSDELAMTTNQPTEITKEPGTK